MIDDDFVCFQDGSDDFDCVMPEREKECEHDHGKSDHCEGDLAVTCVEGKLFRVDCSAAGATCVEQKPGNPDLSGAFCVAP